MSKLRKLIKLGEPRKKGVFEIYKINSYKLYKYMFLLLLISSISFSLVSCDRNEISESMVYTLSITYEGQGQIEKEGTEFSANGYLKLTAVPDQGWEFGYWKGSHGREVDHTGQENVYLINMNGDKDLTAVFKKEGSFGGEIKVHFVDVAADEYFGINHGDAILIEAVENNFRYNILIDAGLPGQGENKVAPYLENLGIKQIHLLICSHAHIDHLGGLPYMLANFEVQKVIDPGLEPQYDAVYDIQKYYEEYLSLIEHNEIEHIEGRTGMEIELTAGLVLEILHPAEPISEHLNNESIVAQLRYDEVGFLFTGDIEKEGEQEILARNLDLANEILKVAHHGGNTSSTRDFLAAVEPEIAVIQVDEDNAAGYPEAEVLDRLKDNNVQIYRNDLHGDIVIETDGQNYFVY